MTRYNIDDGSSSFRSKLAHEAATAAVEEFVNGSHFDRVVEEAVNSALKKLGIDTSNTEKVEAFRDDLAYLRSWRNIAETIKRQGLITTVSIVTSAFFTALAIGVGVLLYKHS